MGKGKSINNFDPSIPLLPMQERFCQLYVNSGCSMTPSKCAYLAGYGRDKGHTQQDYLHNALGKRLMQNERIIARIQYLKDNLAKEDQNFVKNLISRLKDVVMSDPTDNIESMNYTGKYGETKTAFYYKKKWQDIPSYYKSTMVDSIDPRTNQPKLISKQWAIERLLDIYGLRKDNSILDDLASAFNAAGLSMNSPNLSNEVDEAELDEYINGINNIDGENEEDDNENYDAPIE